MASEPLAILIAGVSLVALAGYVVWNERRMRIFFQGTSPVALEAALAKLAESIERSHAAHEHKRVQLAKVEERLSRSIQKVGTVRFNAFPNAGGGQSFATVLLDEKGDGVVLSALHHRDRMSIFAKPIQNYASIHTLSPEEEQAIKNARS